MIYFFYNFYNVVKKTLYKSIEESLIMLYTEFIGNA